jgi:tetratricopeptide (TPR) repeat protein
MMKPTEAQRSLRLIVAGAFALAVLVFIAYHEAPANAFHLDDFVNFADRTAMQVDQLSFRTVKEAVDGSYLTSRPLSNLTLVIDWWRGNGEPATFQWTNIIIHGLNTLAVLLLLLLVFHRKEGRLSSKLVVACVAGAALWSAHPIHVQSVTYIVQRMCSLAALFMLLSMLFFLGGRTTERHRLRWLLLSLAALSFVLAALITPFLILLVEFGVVRHERPLIRGGVDKVLILFPFLASVVVLTSYLTSSGPLYRFLQAPYAEKSFTMAERLLTQPRVVLFHLSQIFWPLPDRFSLEHDFPISTSLLNPWSTALAILFVSAWCLLGVVLLVRKDQRVLGFFTLLLPISLIIESSFVGLEMVFEHRMYFPSVSLAGLASVAILALSRRRRPWQAATAAATAITIGLLLFSTILRVPVWRDERSLALNSIRHAPNRPRVYLTIANSYFQEGKYEEAFEWARRVQKVFPDDNTEEYFTGRLSYDQGNYLEALAHFEAAAQKKDVITPKLYVALANEKLGRLVEACEAYGRVISHDSRIYVRTDKARATALKRRADLWVKLEPTLQEMALTVERQPDDLAARIQLATILERVGQDDEALMHYRNIEQALGPRWGVSYNIALIHKKMGRLDLAEKRFLESLELNDRQPDTLNHLGVLLKKRGDLQGAIVFFERAILLAPERGDAAFNLAKTFWQLRDVEKARAHFVSVKTRYPDLAPRCETYIAKIDRRYR